MSLTIFPFSNKTILSETSVTSCRSWLEIKTVTSFSEDSFLIIFLSLICVVGSKLANGSSRITTEGDPISAATIPTFFFDFL